MKKTSKNYYEYRTIDGMTFRYFPNIKLPAVKMGNWCYSNIYRAYSKPSETKQRIWANWKSWFDYVAKKSNNHDFNTMFISSRNCHFFTIAGNIIDPITGECLTLRISARHNDCYSVQ